MMKCGETKTVSIYEGSVCKDEGNQLPLVTLRGGVVDVSSGGVLEGACGVQGSRSAGRHVKSRFWSAVAAVDITQCNWGQNKVKRTIPSAE
jgi:hypothetical protein